MDGLKHHDTFHDHADVYRKIHRHVPLALGVGAATDEVRFPPPLYWRLDDPAFCLVEIGIDRKDGTLMTATLVNYNGKLHQLSDSIHWDTSKQDVGVPIFSLDYWQSGSRTNNTDYFDVLGQCQLELNDISLRLVLFSEKPVYSVKTSHELICEFSGSRELCSIVSTGLTQREIDILRGAYETA